MVDIKRIPLPPIPPGPLTGETLRSILDSYHREVVAKIIAQLQVAVTALDGGSP